MVLMQRLPSVAPALRYDGRASNSTARTYGWTVDQVETKLSRKDFNKYLSKLQPLRLQCNLHRTVFYYSSPLTIRAMSTTANCTATKRRQFNLRYLKVVQRLPLVVWYRLWNMMGGYPAPQLECMIEQCKRQEQSCQGKTSTSTSANCCHENRKCL